MYKRTYANLAQMKRRAEILWCEVYNPMTWMRASLLCARPPDDELYISAQASLNIDIIAQELLLAVPIDSTTAIGCGDIKIDLPI